MKPTPLRRRFGDAVISLAGVVALILLLMSFDDRVQDHVARYLNAPPSSSEIVGAGKQAASLVSVVVQAVQDQSVAHAPMVIFGVAATVLVLFMLRM